MAEQQRVVHGILQLANVPRPGMLEQARRRIRTQPGRPELQTLPVKLQEMSGQWQNIARALAQRRKLERVSAQAVQELLTEVTCLNRAAQVYIRSGDQANVNCRRLIGAEPHDFTRRQHPQ